MNLEAGHYLQLIIALGASLVLFVCAYVLSARSVIWFLVLLLPFQPIASAYGTINTGLIYMVGAAFFFRGRIRSFPQMGIVALILFIYLLSFSQILPGTLKDHALYMVGICSNFVIFYLMYNYVRTNNNYKDIWKLLTVLNVLALIYCALEMIVGFGEAKLFGLTELSIRSNRASDGRLSGPFTATAMTAEYLGIQSLLCIYTLIQRITFKRRIFWLALLAGNMGFMIATGNRGGVVSLVIGLTVLLFFFRKELGILKIVTWVMSGTFVFIISAFIIVQYTQYNVLFERLEKTEFEGAVPDTRKDWFEVWDRIVEKPILGHGPRLRLMDEQQRRIPGLISIPFPHSGYMYLMYTIGFSGLFAYLWFFASLTRQLLKASIYKSDDAFLQGMPRLGIAVIILVAVSQLRMEMFRFTLSDYQQYLFMLMAIFLSFSHILVFGNKSSGKNMEKSEAKVYSKILQKKELTK